MSYINQLSVFFPAYNEQENILTTVNIALQVCERITDQYEIIVINDGSSDKTKEIVEKLVVDNPRVRLINHNPNQGYGGALKSGIYSARYDTIAFTDSDGQFDFTEIENFLPHLDNYDMVIGYRRKRVEGFKRVIIAAILKVAALILFRLTYKDIDCAFKVFKRNVIEKIPKLESEGALISTELLYKTKKAGFKIKEVPVHHLPRVGGRPTGSNPKVLLKAGVELIKLWIKLH